MTRKMRRADRAVSFETAVAILEACDYGVLATVAPDGSPYAVPVNYVFDGTAIYVHCAPGAGQKLENLRRESRVCFTVVAGHEVDQAALSTVYESVIVFGRARIVEDEGEKRRALSLLVDALCPDFREKGMRCVESNAAGTGVIEIQVEEITGKARTR